MSNIDALGLDEESLGSFRSELTSYKRPKSIHKRRITIIFNSIIKLKNENKLTGPFLKLERAELVGLLDAIKDLDDKVLTLFETFDIDNLNANFFETEIEEQTSYRVSVHEQLAEIDEIIDSLAVSSIGSETSSVSDNLLVTLGKVKNEVKLPQLKCIVFSDNDKDKFAFSNFLNQFKNVVDSRTDLSEAAKLTYLIGYLTGYALKIISHLTINNENYSVALKLLKSEFLDIPYLKDETIKKMLLLSPTFDLTFNATKVYLSEIRSIVYELKNFDIDFLDRTASGCVLLSSIIFEKLANPVKRELVHKIGTNYPLLPDIFDNFAEIVQTLIKTSRQPTSSNSKMIKSPNKEKAFKKTDRVRSVEKMGTLQNYKTSIGTRPFSNHINKPCKLCGTSAHSMFKCDSYRDYNSRVQRCVELSLCSLCSSNKHSARECPSRLDHECFLCKHKTHISALCPKRLPEPPSSLNSLCLTYNQKIDKLYLLPSLSIVFQKGNNKIAVKCLLDFGSQRSYLSGEVARALHPDIDSLHEVDYNIQTFIGSQKRNFKQMSLAIGIGNQHFINMPVLIDDRLNLNYEVSSLNIALKNIVSNGFVLADNSFDIKRDNSHIEMGALLGVDVLQYLPSLCLKGCMNGSCFEFEGKCIPFGNIEHFMYKDQLKVFHGQMLDKEEGLKSEVNISVVNSILEPVKTYFNPLNFVLTDCEVDNGLENLFSLESIGIKTNNDELSPIDQTQIQQFKENIVFKDGFYHVALPWYENKIDKVCSNYRIALKVLDRVVQNLNYNGLIKDYENVFHQYLSDGIIERMEFDPRDYDKYVWIPHRPVFKLQDQVTTKIRPVFNCSLKTSKDSPSLNEAAYSGIDLMTSLLKLLLLFRTNSYVLLSDVKMAFLMIKLKLESDSNRFCFFWKEDDKVICFRYKTIVFGFTSSPFILNYVIKHHISQYPDDKCSHILSNNFYVDNLVMTGNNVRELKDLYKTSYIRMNDGGFTLRSWNTNCDEIKCVLESDQNLTDHGKNEEKVLGYMYDTVKDTFRISDVEFNVQAKSKRLILSEHSKLFDPLGLALPISIRGRLLVRELWGLKLGWDEEVPKEMHDQWVKLANDYKRIPEMLFPRQALNENETYGLHIFCDASQSCYGFIIYACDDHSNSNFIFSKAKVAPLKTYSIPNLELLGVFLAMKCLPSILSSYENIKFKYVNICVDAQVVLSWLLSENLKNKSKFVNNRINEIKAVKEKIFKDFSLPIFFRYVDTQNNPADLLTRGISFKTFVGKVKTYLHGPNWISNDFQNWPKHNLSCISHELCVTQSLVNVGISDPPCILDVKRYSNFNKLMRVTGYLFKFYARTHNINITEYALTFLLKSMQNECFKVEIDFLKMTNKHNVPIPTLVKDLNLFLDDKNLLRCKGRISKNVYYDYNVLHPILIGKNHHLTNLIISDSHSQIQHLGLSSTLNFIRKKGFWITKAKQSIKKVLSSCLICNKFNSFSFKYPKMTDMSKNQMNLVKPFLHTGFDFTGHIYVKDDLGNSKKMFILIFTCLNVRAIHMELVPDMGAKNFLLAFQRFTNLYLIPSYVYSDNARTFIQGGDILAKSMCSEEFSEHLRLNNIQHIKISLYSPWIGSAWERLIRVVKNCMYKVVGRARLSYFELLTVLSNIQNAVNSRPLTYRSSENELEIISPNSFLKLHSNSTLVLRNELKDSWVDDSCRKTLCDTLNVQEEAFNQFRVLWYESYLLSLREHSRNLYQSDWSNRIKVGDVVLIKNPFKPRPFWQMGMVIEIILGFDNLIRSVKLKLSAGHIAHHSIRNLYPLELSITHSPRIRSKDLNDFESEHISTADEQISDVGELISDTGEQVTSVDEIKRPMRMAAAKFGQFMKDKLPDLI